jgi:zinc protease
MTEIDRLRREGPSAEDVRAVKEGEKNDLQTAMRQNGYWLNSLQSLHVLGRDPKRNLQRSERADSLTQENIHAALRKYFPNERHTEVTLMPETRAAQPAQ